MKYIEIGNNTNITLADFKKYAKVVGDADDTTLTNILQQATLRVQEYADRALLPCTIEDDGIGEVARLWQPVVSSIDWVKDASTGVDVISHCTAYADRVFLPKKMAYTIRYKTTPLSSDVSRLLAYIWEAAVAILDGNTEEELKVYQRIPASYVV